MLNDFVKYSRFCAVLSILCLFISSCTSYEKALWDAVENQEVGNVERLLERGADPEKLPKGKSQTLIEVAARKGDPEIVNMLLEKGVHPDSARGSETPLWLAMVNGNELAAIELVDAGANIEGPKREGFSPFYFAVMEDYLDLVTKMVAHKVDIHSEGPAGSPAHEAAENGNFEMLQLLSMNGADMNRINTDGESPIFLAFDAGKYEAAQWMMENGAVLKGANILGNTVLTNMAEKNDTVALRILCGADAAPNTRNRVGESALHRAAAMGHLESAKILVNECQAKINLRDNRGLSPAGLAFREGQTDLVDYLTSAGGRLR